MKTLTLSPKIVILSCLLLSLLHRSGFATVDTINFGGGLGRIFKPATLNVAVGDTILWIGYFGSAAPYHQLQSVSVPAMAEAFGPISANTSYMYVVKVAGSYAYQCNIHCCGSSGNMQGSFTAVTAAVRPSNLATGMTLGQNFPNPFSGSTSFTYSLAQPGAVTIRVFDVAGKPVREAALGYRNAGAYEYQFESAGLPAGTYLYQFQAGEAVLTKEMQLLPK